MVDSSSARFHALDVEAAEQRQSAYPPPSFQPPVDSQPPPAASSFWTRSRLLTAAIVVALAVLLPLPFTAVTADTSATVAYKSSKCERCYQSADCSSSAR